MTSSTAPPLILRRAVAKDGQLFIDSREFDRRIKLYDERATDAGISQLHLNGLDLEKESVLLAPFRKGWLQGSASTSAPRKRGNDWSVVMGFNMEYATATHERMRPAPSAFPMEPGEETRKKPPTRFGKPGGHYIRRPLIGKMDEWTKKIAKAIRRVR